MSVQRSRVPSSDRGKGRAHFEGFAAGHKATMDAMWRVFRDRFGKEEADAMHAAVLDEVRAEIRLGRADV